MGIDYCDGMEDSFPNGLTKVFVEGAGHFVHREKPEQVNARIIEFLKN